MKEKLLNPRFGFITLLVLFGGFMRLIPHWPNFTPVAAIALFGGTYFSRKYISFVIPIAAMFISDLILGFHNNMLTVYIAFAVTVSLGFILRKNVSVRTVLGTSLLASVIFFLITNFSVWLTGSMYPKNFAGLMESYVAALAFFNNGSLGISFFLNGVLGGLFYNTVFFGAFYFARRKFPVLQEA